MLPFRDLPCPRRSSLPHGVSCLSSFAPVLVELSSLTWVSGHCRPLEDPCWLSVALPLRGSATMLLCVRLLDAPVGSSLVAGLSSLAFSGVLRSGGRSATRHCVRRRLLRRRPLARQCPSRPPRAPPWLGVSMDNGGDTRRPRRARRPRSPAERGGLRAATGSSRSTAPSVTAPAHVTRTVGDAQGRRHGDRRARAHRQCRQRVGRSRAASLERRHRSDDLVGRPRRPEQRHAALGGTGRRSRRSRAWSRSSTSGLRGAGPAA